MSWGDFAYLWEPVHFQLRPRPPPDVLDHHPTSRTTTTTAPEIMPPASLRLPGSYTRPVRERKRPRPIPGFIDSSIVALSDDDGPNNQNSDTDADYGDRPLRKKARKGSDQRRIMQSRKSSTPPPELVPVITRLTADAFPPSQANQLHSSAPEKTVQQKFEELVKLGGSNGNGIGNKMNVTGFDGEMALNKPLQLKVLVPGSANELVDVAIDFSQLPMHCNIAIWATHLKSLGLWGDASLQPESSSLPNSTSSSGDEAIANTTSFLSLSGEIRNRIYHFLFTPPHATSREKTVDFTRRSGFTRSGQFLRTCKQIQLEGSGYLYGKNHFTFGRECNKRGNYYEKEWSEVGYQDVHRFLHMIGPANIGLLRRVTFFFLDGTSVSCPDMTTEQRRCVNDPHLLQSLKLLGKHGKLTHINLHYGGRRKLLPKDRKFLKALKKVKADDVRFGDSLGIGFVRPGKLRRVKDSLVSEIWTSMTRGPRFSSAASDERI